jgi:AAA domain-containing protein
VATEKNAMTLSDFEQGMFELDGAAEYKNILVYGDSGVGKTVLAGTLPGRVLMLAGEPGYISAARMGAKGKARLIPDTATAVAAARWLEAGGSQQFDWVVCEGLGTMQQKFLLSYAAEAFDANPTKRAHRNLPDKPDYFNAQNFVKSWVAQLIDLPCNVLFTAHAMRPENDEGERVVYPAIQGKGYEVSNYICGLMHAVGYMSPRIKMVDGQARETRRILWAHTRDPKADTTYFAKDQFNALGRFTDDLSMPQILAIIDSGKQNEVPVTVSAPAEEPSAPAPARKAARAATARRAPARR